MEADRACEFGLARQGQHDDHELAHGNGLRAAADRLLQGAFLFSPGVGAHPGRRAKRLFR
jgi:hypothetical protein